MVLCRGALASVLAHVFVGALPSLRVEYETGPLSASHAETQYRFEARVARLAERIKHTNVASMSLGGALATSFVSEGLAASTSKTGSGSKEALRNALLAEGLPESEAQCARDYNDPCPTGWVDAGDADTRFAPASYEGPCGSSLSFGGLAAHEKMTLAHSCGVVFACLGGCFADFSQACPEGWSLDAAGVCTAPGTYAGPCVGRKDFTNILWADKRVFESECVVRWPCRSGWAKQKQPVVAKSCIADYGVNCPQGWSESNGVCTAPASYSGPCAVAWAFADFEKEEKETVSDMCGIVWPCSK